jgi:thioredoxin-disulfide reductase
MDIQKVKCLIIGSGPAGYTAAIYAARADLAPIIIEGSQPGGQLTITTQVDNFPGYPQGVDGNQMMDDMRAQVLRFGTKIISDTIIEARLQEYPLHLKTESGIEYEAQSLIIATGASARWLGLESENKFRGMGVSACATCDGFFFRGKTVAVVGGGDTACEEASYLANICGKVYMIVRRNVLRASKAMAERVQSNPKIEILWQQKPIEILGDDNGVNAVQLENTQSGQQSKVDIDGIFLAIGHHPNSDVFQGQVATNEEGFILTQEKSQQTNLKGVFAAGDVADPTYRQAICAAGSGAKAAMDAERFLINLH